MGSDIYHNGVITTEEGDGTIPTAYLDSFIEARTRGTYLADKTFLIDRLMSDEGANTVLFCRPRRFGKSINLTMLDAYFNFKHAGNRWFEGTWVSGTSRYDGLRNALPVV